MVFPLDINIGGIIQIPIHLLTDILAFYVGYKYYVYLRKKDGDHISEDGRLIIITGAALGALIGSRMLAFFEHFILFDQNFSLIYLYSNKTIVGGIIGGILGVEIAKKIIRQNVATGDLFTLPLILGIMVGRIGCFLTGVSDGTVGKTSNLPWAFDQGDGMLRHPTSLYEIIFLIIIFFIIKYVAKEMKLAKGVLFRLFVILYLMFRLLIEFIKPVEPIFIGFSAIQIASLGFILYYTYSLIFKYKTFKKNLV